MLFDSMFEQFVNKSPLSVMARATMEHALSASVLDDLFKRVAERGYTRDLLFSTVVDVMSLVVCGRVPHVQAAYKQLQERIPVTLKCVYEKLQNIETSVSAALVHQVADRCQALITESGGTCPPLLPGHRVCILDGNHLAATQKRLRVTRGHSAGPLPGQSLAVLDPATLLITAVIPCADAHAQERALLTQVLPLVQPGDVWIGDRNFCTVDFLLGVSQRQAYFVIRRHGNVTILADSDFDAEVETETGWVSERQVWVCRDDQPQVQVRQVRVRLKQPTVDGDREILLLTNLSAEKADAVTVAGLYLKRWQIEGAFHELTMTLRCEINTLGYPKAALFAFCIAVAAYNVLAVLKAALRVVHGAEKVRTEVSGYYMALEWALVYAGMMIALPAEVWERFGSMSPKELCVSLCLWANKIDMAKIKKAPPRKPTKQKTKKVKDNSPHLSTARLLAEAKRGGKTKTKARNQQ